MKTGGNLYICNGNSLLILFVKACIVVMYLMEKDRNTEIS